MNRTRGRADELQTGFTRAYFGPKTTLTLALLLIVLVACGRTTPPGPNSVTGSLEGRASYLLLDWQEGLRILIWDDIPHGAHGSASTGSTNDPVFRQSGDARTADGRGYEYSLETSDGKQAEFTIDGIPYDLSQGRLFLIHAAGGQTQVEQLEVDLSGLAPTNDGIVTYGQETAEIAAFIASGSG